MKTRPAEWASPAASETSTSTPSATDAQRPGRGRRTPRRAIIDFHGRRSRIATPLVACTTSDHRAGEVANEKAIQPVANATASRISSPRLVRAPSLVGTDVRLRRWRCRRSGRRGLLLLEPGRGAGVDRVLVRHREDDPDAAEKSGAPDEARHEDRSEER